MYVSYGCVECMDIAPMIGFLRLLWSNFSTIKFSGFQERKIAPYATIIETIDFDRHFCSIGTNAS